MRRSVFVPVPMMPVESIASGGQAGRARRIARPAEAVCALLLASAFPSLIYQLSWERALSDILGNGVAAVALPLASLLLGLALGSLAGGALSERRCFAPLPIIAALAMASGALSLAALPMFAVLGVLASGSGLAALAIAAALALVLISALPVGASVPSIVDFLKGPRRVGPAVGRVVGIADCGAAAACLIGGLLWFGLRAPELPDAICIAAVINACVACAALLIHWDARPSSRQPDEPMGSPPVSWRHKPVLRLAPLLSIAAAIGFVAWSYEVFFFRVVLYAAGSSATALVATLGAFLIGLGCGAGEAGRACKILTRDGTIRRAMGALMKANLAGILFLPLVDHTAWLDRGVIGVAVLLTYLAGLCWGKLLPYLAELGIAADAGARRRVAWLAFAYNAGAAAGAGATGSALMAGLGLAASAAMLVVAGLACAAMLVCALAVPRWEKLLRASFVGALALSAMAIIPLGSANVLDRLRDIGAANAAQVAVEAERR
ncbi:MAG TPA: hypothetical protein VKW08_08410 [Xanthobacteraceae bacterium]|nr:hypothetical protein [Xanthobacteraceae bacterium]